MEFRYDKDSFPTVLLAGRYPFADKQFSVNYRSDRHNALHIYDYHGRIELGGRRYAIHPGTITITPAGCDARYDLEAPGFHLCAHFSFPKREGKPGAVRSLPLCIVPGEARSTAEAKFMNLAWWRQQAETSADASHATSLVLQEFLIWLGLISGNPHSMGSGRKARTAVVDAVAKIDRCLLGGIRIKDVCRSAGLSQNYLARLFHRQYGMTMTRYLIKRRIEFARHLLVCTSLPVKEVGARVGIPDPQHFNKLFRKMVGKSPSSYRQEC